MSVVQIDLEMACAAPAEHLWEVLLTPRLWWGEDVLLEPVRGGRFYEPWRDADGAHHTRGTVLLIEPPKRLSLSWRDDDWAFSTEVRFAIEPEGPGSRIRLCHTGWETAPRDRRTALIKAHHAGWAHHLGNLTSCAARSHQDHQEQMP